MPVTEFYQNMHDVRLKPRLLRSLMKNHLPDENHPFPSPSELSTVVTAIKTHELLSESFYGDSVDQKLVDKWKSAVDAWVEQLLLLVSSKMPDKCWAGTCLLGVTFEECSNARFLASYSTWFSKLLPQIQQPSESQFVKVVSCASLSNMLTRLSGILIVKKDGVTLAGKLIQPILNILNEDGSESVWEGAVDLFCTLMNLFPSSVHRHYDSVEAAIVSKIMSGKCNSNLSEKFANCLALLPKTRGDEDSWSLMMQKILIYINIQLNEAFQFLKEETRSSEAMEFLVPPGKKPPPPLGGQESVEASDHAVQRSEQLLFYRVSTLMRCCSMMLTNPYPVQVSVPVRPLLALTRRVLLVDGSSQQALLPFMTVAQQENICSELPSLHLCSLELLTAVIRGIRSQLLPNAAEVVRIVTEYFRRCMLPALRIKVYSLVKFLLISMGVGVALYLAQEVINHAFVDLDFYNHESTTSSNKDSIHATYALQQPSNTKRKHATLSGVASGHQNGLGVEPRSKPATPISVQIAALQALEALLTVGGALRSESWRSKVDFLLINIASNTCEGGWANEERTGSIISGEFRSTWADFQLAALRALLASLLSPARCRPQYLGRSLDLFRRGKQETGTKLAEFCAHALLALEVLIHPRALPLANLSLNNCNGFNEGFNPKFPEKPFSSAQEQNTPFSRGGVLGIDEPDPDDDLYESWLGNGEEVAAPINNIDENMEQADKPSNAEPLTEKLAYDGSVGTLFLDEGRINEPTGNMNVETGRYADEVMVSVERSQVPVAFSKVGTSDKGVMIPCGKSGSSAIDPITSVINRNALDDSNEGAIPPRSEEAAFSKGIISVIDGLPPPDKLVVASSTLLLDKGKQFMSGNESDDSFPDIIDADPDSDSD